MNATKPQITRRSLLRQAAILAACLASPGLTLARKKEPGKEIFAKPALLKIHLTAAPSALATLRKNPREWVDADATVGGEKFPQIALHLKGVTSFLPIDKKPSFTLNFSRNIPGQRLFGLHKIHLNNSVQDPTYVCEDLAGELFRRAGVPCARVAWAKVRLNDRDLGIYVLKEAIGREFLPLHFTDTGGNLYDGGLHHDLWESLELISGNGPKDHADTLALFAATQIADPPARWQKLQQLVDLDRFVSMMAMETLSHHIDGYSLMQNNFFIYFDPTSRRAVFIVHGLDRMFEKPELPIEPPMPGVLSKAILASPDGRKAYYRRLADLAEKVFQPDWINARIDSTIKLLEPTEPLVTPQANALRQRVMTRIAFVRKQLAEQPKLD